ncbi:MAG: LCP family protein [Candidatus Saccharimonadales bacterium]
MAKKYFDIKPPAKVTRRSVKKQQNAEARRLAGEKASFPGYGRTLSAYNDDYFAKAQPKPGRLKRFRAKITKKRVVLFIVAIILVIIGYLAFKFYHDFSRAFGGSIFGIFHSTTLKGESTGRVNILLAGDSADDPGHNGANLTDSIMVISIDTKDKTKSALLLSVPRDLYLHIPNYGYSKINAAYQDGKQDHFSGYGYPNGGMGQLEQIVSQKLGIPIDYYALIDYGALRDAVNAVGGITINIHSPDPRGLYDPSIDYATGGPLVDLSNGQHTLNGEQALDLARARGDAYDSYGFPQADFNRTEHQRQMIVALKSKATTVGVLANPIKVGQLFDSVGKNVKSDLTLSDLRRLYTLTKPIGGNHVVSANVNGPTKNPLLTSYTTTSGQDALVPAAGLNNYSQIQNYVNQLTKFTNN